MKNAQQSIRVALFFLLGIALVWVTFETLSGGSFFKSKGILLVAGFKDLQQLKMGDEVRMAGVKIGSVEKTRLANRRAEALLRIDPGVKVANDAVAGIVMAGLIGTNIMGIDLGSPGAPALADGAEIKTKESPNINTIMTQLGHLGEKLEGALGSFGSVLGGDGKEGGGLFQKLDRLVTENSAKIGQTMTNLQDITTKLNEGQGTIGKLINDPALHDELLATVAELKTTAVDARGIVASAKEVFEQAKSGQGVLGVLLYDKQAADNLRMTVQNIHDVSDKIASGQGTLGKLINDDSLFNSAKSSLKKADRALDSLNDSGPISAVGILANSLF